MAIAYELPGGTPDSPSAKRKRKRGGRRDLSHLPTGWYVTGIQFPDEQPAVDPDEARLSEQVRSGRLLRLMVEHGTEGGGDRDDSGGGASDGEHGSSDAGDLSTTES